MRGGKPGSWRGLAVTALAVTLSACGALPATPGPPAGALDPLVRAAQAEGTLTVMTLPHNWCNYGALITTFKQRYGLQVTELNPDGSSADEMAAMQANQAGDLRVAPDVVDMGLAFGPVARAAGLLQPYRVATWDTIPAAARDPDGYWYGSYYGVMVLEVNTRLVPQPPTEWADLLRPAYHGQVALAGDPRRSGQAIASVYAVALGVGGSLDAAPAGLDFFAQLHQRGNLLPVIATQQTVASGATPIVLRWDFNALADRDALAGSPPIGVIVPSGAVLAGISIQAISAYAPHPQAARLWMEYLYADGGQLGWLQGYCHPIRYNDLATRNAIPAALAARLPPAEIYAGATFPTVPQYSRAKDQITTGWDRVVGLDIK
ncbi:MAG TPA: extracellular solute-binding protein [Chloroflexia bacterium]|nr:extracellular solute-binding protein [Chloroflexia bacterium]